MLTVDRVFVYIEKHKQRTALKSPMSRYIWLDVDRMQSVVERETVGRSVLFRGNFVYLRGGEMARRSQESTVDERSQSGQFVVSFCQF